MNDKGLKILEGLKEFASNLQITPTNNEMKENQSKPELKKSIYNILPKSFQDCVNSFNNDTEKEIFFISTLTLLSGILSNYSTKYFKKSLYANLYLYIIAGYGTGKGVATHAKDSLSKIKGRINENNKEIIAEHKKELALHKAKLAEEKSQANKDFEKIANLEENPPEEPQLQKLFFAFNNSESNIVKLLQENNERAIFFSTEGDVVSNAISKEYNQTRSLFNAAFQHEPYDFERLQVNNCLESPKITFLITSTFDQFIRFIRDEKDGLFSRLILYSISSDVVFNSPFDSEDSSFDLKFEEFQDFNLDLYEFLQSCEDTPIEFQLQKHQTNHFVEFFQIEKIEAMDVDESLAGIVHRRAVNFMKIAMTLSAINSFSNNKLMRGTTIYCEDEIYLATIDIIQLLNWYTHYYLDKLPNKQPSENSLEEAEDELQKIKEIIHLYNSKLSCREIAARVFGEQNRLSKKSYVHRVIVNHKATIEPVSKMGQQDKY